MHNPIKRINKELETKEEMIEFAVNMFKVGTERMGICYRANIFIFKNDGTINLLYNNFKGINMATGFNLDIIAEFVQLNSKDDFITIYETTSERYSVVTIN